VTHGWLAIFFPENIGNEELYYYFAAPFMDFIGNSVFALRLPPVFLSLISACIIWALAHRLFGPVVALTALSGFAVAFWTVAFGRILLHVVMEVPLAALSAHAFWRAREAKGRRALALYALSVVGGDDFSNEN
jgi:4-amino-4-deoxy-L-arabinose transferase-like glycosyltransferase